MSTPPQTQTGLNTPEQVLRLIAGSRLLFLDLETCGPAERGQEGGLNPRQGRIRLITLHDAWQTCCMDCFAYPAALPLVLEALKSKILVIHNASFDPWDSGWQVAR